MITRYESEWQYKNEKWDSLVELMGHSDSDPQKGWVEEKGRIETLSWWDSLIGQHGITGNINVQYIHPLGMIGNFSVRSDRITLEMLRAVNPAGAEANHQSILPYLNKYAVTYKLDQPRAIAHFLSQIAHESGLRVIEESLRFSPRQMKKNLRLQS